MSAEEDTENEETENEEEEQEIDNEDNDNLNIPPNDVQKSSTTDIATDEDYYSENGSMIENEFDEDNEDYQAFQNGGGHKRVGSFADKRESIHRQKAEMEAKLRTLSQKLDAGNYHHNI